MNSNDQLKGAIEEVVEYMWHDELKNWAESGRPKNHIYHAVKVLAEYVNGPVWVREEEDYFLDNE